jgi:uncharacterized protein (TIGR00725 family)
MKSEDIKLKRKPILVGVIGGHTQHVSVLNQAQELGKRIAKKGYVLLTGGGPGVMEAASKGAHEAGGLVIGILPNDRAHPLKDYPNAFVDIAIYTGMLDGRNVINAKTPHVIIALKGSYGTISEIALALKAKTPVISFNCPEYDHLRNRELFQSANTVEQVISLIEKLISETLN